jgi:predicted transposase YdaD
MLLTEWNWDDAKEVWQEEAHARGERVGYERGQEETQQKAEENAKQEKLESARKFKEMGMSIEQIAAGISLSVEEIEKA